MDEQTQRMYDLMKHESKRLQTFQMDPPWPKDYVDIKKLAKAGFFYGFMDDNVHCAFCRGQVCRWDREDDPMSEHARHFSTCPFIMGGDVGNIPLGEDPFPGPKRPRPYDVCGIYQNNPNEQYRTDPPFLQTHGVGVLETHQESRVNNHQMNNITANSNIDQYRNNETNSENFNGICKICYTNSIQVCFVPCGHSMTCLSCSQELNICPCCRAHISWRQRTYIM